MFIEPASRPIVIAEAGVNHNGSLDRAIDLVDASADAGADIVKFQAFSTDTLVSGAAPAASYQKSSTGHDSQDKILRDLELDTAAFETIAAHCRKRGIAFLCTPFDVEMLDDLLALGMPAIKIASGEITNAPALRRFGAKGAPILLSTGMANLDEVREAVATLNAAGAGPVTVLHCTSLYPAPAETLNLTAIETLQRELNLPVGYSDHSEGVHMSVAAAALGACVIEKHVTLDRSLPGPDHAASLEPDELARLVRQVREVALALGDGQKQPHPLEAETAFVARRSWHAVKTLPVGHVLAEEDVVPMRPESGIPANRPVAGRRLTTAVSIGQPVRVEDISRE